MTAIEIDLPNLGTDPMWQSLQKEVTSLLDDLKDDHKYKDRVTFIRQLLADPQFLRVEQIYFITQEQICALYS
jgi:hypothetical protein